MLIALRHFFPSLLKWKVIFIDEMYLIHSSCDSVCNSHATCQSSFRNLRMEDIKLMYELANVKRFHKCDIFLTI